MRAWCRECREPRQAKAFSRDQADWTCDVCGTLLSNPPKQNTARPAAPKRSRPPRRSKSTKAVMRPEVREAMVLWARAGICTVCKQPACQTVRGHHVLYQQWLRDRARTLQIDPVPLLEDPRGWLRVGDRCHDRHHDAIVRIPRLVLVENCPDVFAFAAEYGLSERLNRTYPDQAKAAA